MTNAVADQPKNAQATSLQKNSQQFQLLKHRFKLRQKAPLSNLVLKGFSAVPTSDKHLINSVRMNQLGSLISKVSAQIQLPNNRFKYR